jgi:Zn-dependent protease with chaperone function
MDFFEHQEVARRKARLLVFYYLVAVALITVAVYLAVSFAFSLGGESGGGDWAWWNPVRFLSVLAATGLTVVSGTVYKVSQLAQGGEAVAGLLGGRIVPTNTRDASERRLLNVVEEMALASGTPIPRVYVLDEEPAINAFAAGFSTRDAVIAVTRGTLESLNRDELQGVIAHEFSHILNGDMRLNIRLMGVLFGILLIALVGRGALHAMGRGRVRSRSGKGGGGVAIILLLAVLLMVIGYIGVFFAKLIKSAVSRQREYLADASSVQFTRNPAGDRASTEATTAETRSDTAPSGPARKAANCRERKVGSDERRSASTTASASAGDCTAVRRDSGIPATVAPAAARPSASSTPVLPTTPAPSGANPAIAGETGSRTAGR